jgi:Glycosyl transferase family 2/Glycosyl transferases group 1
MKIAFIDHSYHKKTLSTTFLTKLLFPDADVDTWWDQSWAGEQSQYLDDIESRDYDLVIVCQMELVARELALRARRDRSLRVLFVPMWDSCRGLGEDYWRDLDAVKILSFSRALHERLRVYGLISCYTQYFPDPSSLSPITDYSCRRGFFWPRVGAVAWPHIRTLVGDASFSSFHLHMSLDPGAEHEPQSAPLPEEVTALNLTTSTWFESADAYRAVLANANVFFAPRLSEGIGMSILEAMAMGICVVANNMPTMNEYIVSGVNGMLADLSNPSPVDLSRFDALGRRARDSVIAGYERWQNQMPCIRQFVTEPAVSLRRQNYDYFRFRNDNGSRPPHRPTKQTDEALPRVTVATVTFDAEDTVEATICSVLRQDYSNLEYLVIDGGSSDSTCEIVRRYGEHLDYWVSEPDHGPYDAMNKAALHATGDYILFMNAGDWFVGDDAVSRCFRNVPDDVNFVVGHNVYRTCDGIEHWHQAADFEETWSRLRAGTVDGLWLRAIPGHQATFTRIEMLRKHRYDVRFRFAADHEFMFRMRCGGAKFYHSLETVAVYVAGGLSFQNMRRTADEWIALAEQYGAPGTVALLEDVRRDVLAKQKVETKLPDDELVTLTAERDALAAEREILAAKHDVLNTRLDAWVTELRQSRSWRITAKLRRDHENRPLDESPVEAKLDLLVAALGSLSWELTAPLRLPMRLLHRLRRLNLNKLRAFYGAGQR